MPTDSLKSIVRKDLEKRTFLLTSENLKFINRMKAKLQLKGDTLVSVTQSGLVNDIIRFAKQNGYAQYITE